MDSRITLTFAVGLAAGACLGCWIHQKYVLQCHSAPLHKSKAPSSSSTLPPPPRVRNFAEDDVLSEQFTRNVQFFGMEGQQKIANAFVVVIGLGGVGSHAAHLLLRSGVGRLRLVDFDQVSLSSLNRHALATREDVGTPKAVCLKKRFLEILPEADVEAMVEMYNPDKDERLLDGNPDFVLDAIDNVDTKVALVAACKKRGIRVLCCAGAGAKADPSRVRIVDLSESSIDPLARSVRQRLRKEHNIGGDVPVLLSTEKPRCGLVTLVDESENLLDYQVVPGFRIRSIPVLGTTPAIFGLAAAGYILCQLAGQPIHSEPIIKLQTQQYERQLHRLMDSEQELYGSTDGVAVDMDDIVFLVRELWRGVSARAPPALLPGADKGLMRSTANLVLTRWECSRPATVDNLVLLTREEAAAHQSSSLEQLRRSEPKFVDKVERLLAWARQQYM